jgi:hypothetical protein
MNKVLTSVSIDTIRPLTQENLNEIEAFKTSVKPNERIRIDGTYGPKIIFTRYKESGVDQGLRQIGNLISKFKNAAEMNNAFIHTQLLNLKKKAGKNKAWAPEINKIHAHISKKFHASEKISLTSSNFQSLIDPLTKKLLIPVFETLQTPATKEALKVLALKYERIPTRSEEVTFLSRSGEKLSDVAEEMRSFIGFVKDQAKGKSATYPDRKAVDFAERWMTFESGNQKSFMPHLFGDENFKSISHAAAALLKFIEDK